MSHLLPRYRTPAPADTTPRRRHLDDKLRQIEDRHLETQVAVMKGPPPDAVDRERLRGIPVTAAGVGGTSPGTDPLAELLRSDRRLRYRHA